MTHFFGTLKGRSATVANRTGTKHSGISAVVGTQRSHIRTELRHIKGRDVVVVTLSKDGLHTKIFDGELSK